MSFDVVIPLGPNDEDIINHCIDSVRKYVWDFRKIYVVAHRLIELPGVTVIDECIFPFLKGDIQSYIKRGSAGWYLQKLLKLYSPSVIPDIHTNVVVIDADTVFYKPVKFMNERKFLFNMSNHVHQPYFDHMLRLHSSFTKWKRGVSGIVNIMIINRSIIKEIIDKVEAFHKEPFWKVFMSTLDPEEPSSASEYEIYFHYIMKTYPNRVELRPLQYDNSGKRDKKGGGFYHYVNYHAWNQKQLDSS